MTTGPALAEPLLTCPLSFRIRSGFYPLLIQNLLKQSFWGKYRAVVKVTKIQVPLQHSTWIFTRVSEMPGACVDLCRPSSFCAYPNSSFW